MDALGDTTKVILVFCEDARFETRDPIAVQVVRDAVLRETMQTAIDSAQRWRAVREMFGQNHATPEGAVSNAIAS